MKKYRLFLDESGDFDRDLNPDSKRNPSLVGGFLAEEKLFHENSINGMVTGVLGNKNHATELSREEKGLLAYELLTRAVDQDITFVIFQNNEKQKLGNSTLTYLAVLTEGLMQLTKYLVMKHAEAVELEVVAGFKKDATKPVTSSFVEGYIPLKEYRQRLDEKIILEKAKLHNDNIRQSRIKIWLEDDKRNNCLILCDYICNFWYTMPAQAFSVIPSGKDQCVRELLKPLYNEDMVFPLFCTEEDEHVIRMLQDGMYADALFECCAGTLTERNMTLIRESLLVLTDKQLDLQLNNLMDYIGAVFHTEHEFEEGGKVLQGATELLQYLLSHNRKNPRFYLDIRLYELTYYNHMQNLEKMAEIFAEMEPRISRYTAETLDVDYFLIYFTRKAVYLNEIGKYSECYALCEKLEQMLEFIEMSMLDTGCVQDSERICSAQLGKVLGTRLQAMIFMCGEDQSLLEEARVVSDKAISQFVFEEDLKRQYQYRAELEAVCGCMEEAFAWLEKSFGEKSWKQYMSSGIYDAYDLYNLLYVVWHNREEHRKTYQEVVTFARRNCRKIWEADSAVAGMCREMME